MNSTIHCIINAGLVLIHRFLTFHPNVDSGKTIGGHRFVCAAGERFRNVQSMLWVIRICEASRQNYYDMDQYILAYASRW